jgi:predicted DCC family thiol-disulfide oxidoreductase YuxK
LCYPSYVRFYKFIDRRADAWHCSDGILAHAFIFDRYRPYFTPYNDHACDNGVLTVAQLTIFFDGGCPLCAREIGHLERLDHAKNLAFEDIYAPLFSERFPHIDQHKADQILHGQWHDGGIIYGLEVTYHSWALVGKGHWVAILRWPIFKQLAQLGYRFFARYRHRISALLTGELRCDRCDIGGPSK